MNTTSPVEPNTSPAPGIIPEPSQVHAEAAASTPEGSRRAAGTTAGPAARRGPLARVLAALRGDKYMVGAYAPGGPPPSDG
jgi:hypothetical protein